MNIPLSPIAAISLTCLFTTGCLFSGKRSREADLASADDKAKKKGGDQVAWNAFGDPNWKNNVNGSIDRARETAAGYNGRPGRNPDLHLPPVDPSRARSVSYSSVNVSGPFLAMTFDDGPHPTLTPRLLDILKERNIKATFFVVAPNTKRYPHIIQRMIAEGHEVANHTVNHPTNMSRLSDDRVRSEFQGCEESILTACGRRPLVMRPPGGSINSAQKVWINDEFGYKTILWSCDPEDWKRPGVGVVTQRIVAGAKNGAIILAHDIHAPTIAAVPAAMDGILAKGYRFVTVSQLISMEQPRPTVTATAPANAVPGAAAGQGAPALETPPLRKVQGSIPAPQPLPFQSTPQSPAAAVETEGFQGPALPQEESGSNPG